VTIVGDDLHRLEIEPVELWADAAARRVAGAIGRAVAGDRRCVVALAPDREHHPVIERLVVNPLDWDRVTILPTHEMVDDDPDQRLIPPLRRIFDGLPVTWLAPPVDEVTAGARPGGDRASGEAGAGARPGGDRASGEVGAGALLGGDRASGDRRADATRVVLDRFDRQLEAAVGAPPVIDLSVLGLGADGSTAGLRPGDPVLGELRRYSAIVTGRHGRSQLTLTRPIFDRCRAVLWLVTGGDRSAALGRMLMGDLTLPAGTVRPRSSVIVADSDAARQA
jgi:6-phosphogluconolactonase/glucosamine-6-phosphate isomerase/deaminase